MIKVGIHRWVIGWRNTRLLMEFEPPFGLFAVHEQRGGDVKRAHSSTDVCARRQPREARKRSAET